MKLDFLMVLLFNHEEHKGFYTKVTKQMDLNVLLKFTTNFASLFRFTITQIAFHNFLNRLMGKFQFGGCHGSKI